MPKLVVETPPSGVIQGSIVLLDDEKVPYVVSIEVWLSANMIIPHIRLERGNAAMGRQVARLTGAVRLEVDLPEGKTIEWVDIVG